MKKFIRKGVVIFMIALLMSAVTITIPDTTFVIEAEAHQGRTDSSGGHKDNKNKSGLGYYHYHCGGYPAHLHENGICPYSASPQQSSQNNNSSQNSSETSLQSDIVLSGWQKDSTGWWYLDTDGTYPHSAWKEIENKWYYFGADGYLLTNCHTPDGHQVDQNGVWIN